MNQHNRALAETKGLCPECLQQVPSQYEAVEDGAVRDVSLVATAE